MSKEAMEGALKAINEETEKIFPVLRKIKDNTENLSQEQSILFEEIRKRLELLISLSRYEHDVRGSLDL